MLGVALILDQQHMPVPKSFGSHEEIWLWGIVVHLGGV